MKVDITVNDYETTKDLESVELGQYGRGGTLHFTDGSKMSVSGDCALRMAEALHNA